MKTSLGVRAVLCGVGATALLSACGGLQMPLVTPDESQVRDALQTKHFLYTGQVQYFKVPAGITKIRVDAIGARGGGSSGGDGGRIDAVLPVTRGERLAVFVGGEGAGTNSGFNGGANGGVGPSSGGNGSGGGGASDLRQSRDRLHDRIVVAAGGGGVGGGSGANGSGPLKSEGGGGGTGGTQQNGGAGGSGGYGSYNYGAVGNHGSFGAGGSGGVGCVGGFCEGGGGAGGGYYRGGGGGNGAASVGSNYGGGGGGGGGSSFAESKAQDVHIWKGWKSATGNGEVTISWR